MSARVLLLALLLMLLLPLAGSATPSPSGFQGPSFTPAVLPIVPPPLQLTLPPSAAPAALTFPFAVSVSSTPRVLPASPGNSGSQAWIDTRGGTKLFTGSIPETSGSIPTPEPSTAALLALGFALLAARRR